MQGIIVWIIAHKLVIEGAMVGIIVALLDGYLAGDPNGKYAGIAREILALLGKNPNPQIKK